MSLITKIIIFTQLIKLSNGVHIKVVPEYLNGNKFSGPQQCEIPCEYFADSSNPDAEFFIVMGNGMVKDAISTKRVSPIRIIGSQEPDHICNLLRPEFLRPHFQGMAFLNRESDIPWPIMPDMDKMKTVEISKNAAAKATFVAYRCDRPNNRDGVVKGIAEVIEVVALSDCLRTTGWPQCGGRPCTKVEAIREYKIHLAFENGDPPGYVSEKIYQAFEAGVLPVYMGTRGVSKAVPKGSYIDVAEFETAHDLGLYLKMVLENETLYNSYFEWKNKPFDDEFEGINRILWTENFFCHLCYYVDAMKRGVEWDHSKLRAKQATSVPIKTNQSMAEDFTKVEPKIEVVYMPCEDPHNTLLYLATFLNLVLLLIIFKKILKCSVYSICKPSFK